MTQIRRVVLVNWKNSLTNRFEIFSSLKIFCESYPQYSYNTLSNYLSKRKMAYSNADIHVERKEILTVPTRQERKERRIKPIVRRVRLNRANDYMRDLAFWLEQSPLDRITATAELASFSVAKGQRLDKTRVSKQKYTR